MAILIIFPSAVKFLARNFDSFIQILSTMKRKLSTEENKNSESETEIQPKRITRSTSILLPIEQQISKKPKLQKDDRPKKLSIPISKCPFIDFAGQIEYHSTSADISKACTNILTSIESTQADCYIPFAFDMEWPFNFKTGPGKSSVLQLCRDEEICYIFSIGELKILPNTLTDLLLHSKVLLHGVNIKNDLRKLERDFPDVKSDLLIAKCLDLGTMCNDIKNTSGRWSLEKLVNKICRLRIDKSNKIRMSKWNVVPLEEVQLKYAAIDVYIGQVIYRKLEEVKLEKTKRIKIKTTEPLIQKD